MLAKRYQLPSHWMNKFWRSNDYSTVTIVSHTVLCTWKLLKKVDLKCWCLCHDHYHKKKKSGGRRGVGDTSLVVQWLRIHLLRQETRVWSLVQEHPTCLKATKPVQQGLSPCAATTEGSMCPRAPALQQDSSPSLATTRESPIVATKTQHSQK